MYVIGIQKLCNYGINSIEKNISQLASSDNISIFSLSRFTKFTKHLYLMDTINLIPMHWISECPAFCNNDREKMLRLV